MMKNRNKFITALIAATLLLLSGCGFKMRSKGSLPNELKSIYLETENRYGKVERNLKNRLISYDVSFLDKPNQNSLILSLSSRFSHNDPSPSSSTQARIYDLTYNATIKIRDGKNRELLKPQQIIVTRSISLQPNEVFANTPEVEISKTEMALTLIDKIIDILTAPKTAEALR